MDEKRTTDLETLAQHLQQRLRLYEDHRYMENLMEGVGKYKVKEEKYDFMNRLCSIVNLKVSWSTKKLKVCMHETMITMGDMMATTGMMSIMRAMVTMMKA